jgi:hypothetical protein
MGGGQNIMFLLIDGVLETYMEPYELPAETCLSVMLLDAFYDDVETPPSDDPDAAKKFKEIAKLAAKRMTWTADKKALLEAVVIDPEDTESPAGAARARRQVMAEKAAGYQRVKEERKAADMVDSLPSAIRSQRRHRGSVAPEASVGLAINFVP